LISCHGPLVAGELDSLTAELDRLVQNWAARVVIDMSDCPFADSAGLEQLCHYHRKFTQRGLELKLSGLTEMTGKILELTRVSRRFQIFTDISTAVRSFL